MTGRKKTKRWSYIAGEKGRNRVRAFALDSGRLHLEFMEAGKRTTVSLGHCDQDAAKQKADEVAASFGEMSRVERTGELTLGTLFDNYLREVTPGKTPGTQQHDQRRARLWLEVLGSNHSVAALNSTHARLYISARKARGDLRKGPGGSKRDAGVRARTWRADLALLKAAIHWAVQEGLLTGAPGILVYRDRSKTEVRRPIVTEEEMDRLLEGARQVGPDCFCFAVLAHETGHRSGAIRQLRWSDLSLAKKEVRWRPELDKIGHDHTTPLTDAAIEALKQLRGSAGTIGEAFVFQAPKTLGTPASRSLVKGWWKRMRQHAGLALVPGQGWHSLRRKFASDLKQHPLVDVAALGGWKDTTTITRNYQQPDETTMREVLMRRRAPILGAIAEVTAEASRIVAEKRKPRLG